MLSSVSFSPVPYSSLLLSLVSLSEQHHPSLFPLALKLFSVVLTLALILSHCYVHLGYRPSGLQVLQYLEFCVCHFGCSVYSPLGSFSNWLSGDCFPEFLSYVYIPHWFYWQWFSPLYRKCFAAPVWSVLRWHNSSSCLRIVSWSRPNSCLCSCLSFFLIRSISCNILFLIWSLARVTANIRSCAACLFIWRCSSRSAATAVFRRTLVSLCVAFSTNVSCLLFD